MAETQTKPTIKKSPLTIGRAKTLMLLPKDLIPQFEGVVINVNWEKMKNLCNEYIEEREFHITDATLVKDALDRYLQVITEGDLF